MAEINWVCPFCGVTTLLRNGDVSTFEHGFKPNDKMGGLAVFGRSQFCRNKECQRYTLTLSLVEGDWFAGRGWVIKRPLQFWNLIPESQAKEFPDYVPAPVINDYREACRIRDPSPKASATLARRCLQGMIRDFWGITKHRLVDEINALEEKVSPEDWAAIDGVRSVGNIGAHMETDINVIVDVEPDEAALLLGLIETLIEDWYVARFNKKARMKAVADLATAKKAARNPPAAGAPSA